MMLGKVELSSCFYRVTELRTQSQLLHMDFISFVTSNTRILKVKKPVKNAIAESAVSVRFLDSIAKWKEQPSLLARTWVFPRVCVRKAILVFCILRLQRRSRNRQRRRRRPRRDYKLRRVASFSSANLATKWNWRWQRAGSAHGRDRTKTYPKSEILSSKRLFIRLNAAWRLQKKLKDKEELAHWRIPKDPTGNAFKIFEF